MMIFENDNQKINLYRAAISRIWAISKSHLEYMLASLPDKINLVAVENQKPQIVGSTAILPIYGIITQKADIFTVAFGGTSAEITGAYFSELAKQKEIKTIIFDIDSPGGEVFGLSELVDKIKETKNGKKIIAISNSLMASGAYWIGSIADEIIITPSGLIGSIGVISIHEEISEAAKMAGIKYTIISAGENKADGNQYEPLSNSARDEMQKRVNYYYDMFVKSVASNRGITPKQLKETYGQGKLYTADEAIKLGVADKIGTLEKIVNKLREIDIKKNKLRNQAAIL